MALSFNIALAISGAREIRLAIWTCMHPSSRLIVYAGTPSMLCYAMRRYRKKYRIMGQKEAGRLPKLHTFSADLDEIGA